MNRMHLAVFEAGGMNVRGLEEVTEKVGAYFAPGYGKLEKNPAWRKGRRRRHFWVVRTKS